MNQWRQLRATADLMAGEQIERDIWSLRDDPRLPALLAVLADVRFTRLAQGSSVNAASDHGVLAHCLGAVDAIDEVERRLESMIEPPPSDKEEK